MKSVRVQNLSKQFGPVTALKSISLDIAPGELFFLLGPSGCGKSTLLRLIAGLEEPTHGHILFNDRDVTSLGTEKRNAVMCFQSYALWPHLTVAQNVEFGLRSRGISSAQIAERTDQVLDLVAMREYARRKPNALSGGQQQRVALARALAVQPDCLLLDEPLSNLDAKMRFKMRGEIRRICKTAGLTTIYVTHDQKEALSIADRIALLKDGQIVQVGTPRELYHEPTNAFVADFIGASNLIAAKIVSRQGRMVTLDSTVGVLHVESLRTDLPTEVVVSVRPDQLRRASPDETQNRLIGNVVDSAFLGESTEYAVDVNGNRLRVAVMPPEFDQPQSLALTFGPADGRLLGAK